MTQPSDLTTLLNSFIALSREAASILGRGGGKVLTLSEVVFDTASPEAVQIFRIHRMQAKAETRAPSDETQVALTNATTAAQALAQELRSFPHLDHPNLRFAVRFAAAPFTPRSPFAFGLESWWALEPEDMTPRMIAHAIQTAMTELADFFPVPDRPRGKLTLWDSAYDRHCTSIYAEIASEAFAKRHIFAAHLLGPQYAQRVRAEGKVLPQR